MQRKWSGSKYPLLDNSTTARKNKKNGRKKNCSHFSSATAANKSRNMLTGAVAKHYFICVVIKATTKERRIHA